MPEVQKVKGNRFVYVIRGKGILTVILEGSVEEEQKRGKRKLKLFIEVKTES